MQPKEGAALQSMLVNLYNLDSHIQDTKEAELTGTKEDEPQHKRLITPIDSGNGPRSCVPHHLRPDPSL